MPSQESLHLPKLIAVLGREGSGKDSYGNHLLSLGYIHISAGDVIRAVARSQGHENPIPRSTLSRVGDEMKRQYGPSPITERSMEELRNTPTAAGLVISGLRRTGEVSAFVRHGAVAIWIEANDERRYANLHGRARGDEEDYATFVERSVKEYNGATEGGMEGVNIREIEMMATLRVENNGTLQNLFQNADQGLALISTNRD